MKKFAFAAVAAAALFAAPSQAQTSDRDVMAVMAKCAAITDTAQRLACYDSAAPNLQSQMIKPPQVTRAPTQEEQSSWFGFSMPNIFGGGSPDAPQTTPQSFGSNTLSQQQRASIGASSSSNAAAAAAPVAATVIDSISATVTDYALNPQGRYVLFLDNGQVWRQQGGDSGVMQFKRNAPNRVRISRGFWDSYNLKLNDGSALFKVIRVK